MDILYFLSPVIGFGVLLFLFCFYLFNRLYLHWFYKHKLNVTFLRFLFKFIHSIFGNEINVTKWFWQMGIIPGLHTFMSSCFAIFHEVVIIVVLFSINSGLNWMVVFWLFSSRFFEKARVKQMPHVIQYNVLYTILPFTYPSSDLVNSIMTFFEFDEEIFVRLFYVLRDLSDAWFFEMVIFIL